MSRFLFNTERAPSGPPYEYAALILFNVPSSCSDNVSLYIDAIFTFIVFLFRLAIIIVSLLVPLSRSLSLESTPNNATFRYPLPLFFASFETLNLSVSNFTVLIFESLLATMTAPIAATVTNVPPRMAPIFLPRDQAANPLVFDLRPRLLYLFLSFAITFYILSSVVAYHIISILP